MKYYAWLMIALSLLLGCDAARGVAIQIGQPTAKPTPIFLGDTPEGYVLELTDTGTQINGRLTVPDNTSNEEDRDVEMWIGYNATRQGRILSLDICYELDVMVFCYDHIIIEPRKTKPSR